MPIRIQCRHCGKKYSFKDEAAGTTIRCRQCSKPIQIPVDADDFLDSLADAIDEGRGAAVLPPKATASTEKKGKRKRSRTSWKGNTGQLIATILFAVTIAVGLILLAMIGKYNGPMLGVLLFFTAIFTAVSYQKMEPENRWSVPAAGLVSAMCLFQLIGSVRLRSGGIFIDFMFLAVGLGVLIGFPGIVGVTILGGYYLLNLLILNGTLDPIYAAVMDQDLRNAHILICSAVLTFLLSGYCYSLWNRFSESQRVN